MFLPAAVRVHRETAPGRELRALDRRLHAGDEERQLEEVAAVERQRLNPALVDDAAQLRRLRLDRLDTHGDIDLLGEAGDREAEIQPEMRIDEKRGAQARALEARRGRRHVVHGRRQIREPIESGVVGHGLTRQAAQGVGRSYRGSRDGLSAGIGHVPGYRPGRDLRRERPPARKQNDERQTDDPDRGSGYSSTHWPFTFLSVNASAAPDVIVALISNGCGETITRTV